MASIQTAQQQPPRSSAPGYRSSFTTSTASSRLRDSCHGCASSKVKCTKEKPTCSRCAKRGTRCEYLVTKRPGRRHDSRASDGVNDVSITTMTTEDAPESSTLSAWQTAFPAGPCAEPTASPSYSVQLPNPSTFNGLSSEFDEFFNSPLSFSLPDASDFELLDAPNTSSSGVSTSSSSTSISGRSQSNAVPPEDIIYLFGERSRSPSLPSGSVIGQIPGSNTLYRNAPKDFETSHRCFPRALNTLNKLSAGDTNQCMMSGGELSHDGTSGQRVMTVHAVISRNEHAINEMSRILQCSCSTNSFLLTTVALVVFKVLDWYAAAARMSTAAIEERSLDSNSLNPLCSPDHRSSTFNGELHQRKDAGYDRQSAQLVLIELHRVQRFLSRLSPKLQACEHGHQSRRGSVLDSNNTSSESQPDGVVLSKVSPFSSAVLEQLEPEVRKRIRSLSLEIIEFLRAA